ncbi:hypothetical protein [Pseudomonas lactis]|uniref:hypothetical protein n=1 Tax=Pseudomonas lactis TaxID=1615674 RepID=UPI00345DE746
MVRNLDKHVLEPVDIPLMYPPIADDAEGADGGIGRLHVTRDLVVYVDYPFSAPVGTTFQLIWHGPTPVGFYLVRDGDPPRTRFPLTVPAHSILEGWADAMYCRIIPDNEPPQQTPPLRLRINLQRPGGKAPEPTDKGHGGLVFKLEPQVELEGVDEQKARDGVTVTCHKWENMGPYDLLTLVWGSEKVEHRVQPNEVGRDIEITVTPEMILAAGNSDILPVAMTVTGNTGNLPDEDAMWSVVSYVEVYTDSQRMEPPWVDYPLTESEINLANIGNDAVRVGFYLTSEDAHRYTHVHFYWIGTLEDGGTVPHSEMRELAGTKAYYFEIPNAVVAAIARGRAIVYYVLDSQHGSAPRSNYRHVTVIGEIRQWLAPSVEGESDGQIDPDLAQVKVHIPVQPGWQSFQALELILLASDAGGTIEHRVGIDLGELSAAEDQLTVVLEGDDLRRFKGRLADLFYRATKDGEKPRESWRRSLRIGELQPDMPAPIVRDELEGELHLNNVSPFGTPIDAPFSDVEFGDWITLCIKGVHSIDLPKQANIPGVAVSFDVLPQDLEPNRGEDTSLYYTLKRGNLPERYSLTTPLRMV